MWIEMIPDSFMVPSRYSFTHIEPHDCHNAFKEARILAESTTTTQSQIKYRKAIAMGKIRDMLLKTLRPTGSGRHFVQEIFKCI